MKPKPATVNRELSLLKRAFKLGLKNKRVLADHVPYVTQLKENNTRKGFLEPHQYDRLVTELSKNGLWLRTLFECGYTWGFRKGELVISEGQGGLKVGQVDFLERVVRLEVGETKNDEGREVPMTNIIFELLKVLCHGKQPTGYVFTRKIGKEEVPVQSFRKTWMSACKRAGVPNLIFHDLRRSAVRVMVRSGVPEKTAMTISGHKTRSMFDRYNIVSNADKVDAMQKREAYLKRVHENSDGPSHAHSAHTGGVSDPKITPVQASKLLN
jgi:integrase